MVSGTTEEKTYKIELKVGVMLKGFTMAGIALNVPNIMLAIEEAITNEYGGFESHVRTQFCWITDMDTGELASDINIP